MDDTLIKSECYICFEPCLEKSPCSCGTSVHNECLVKFLKISDNLICTICTDEFKIDIKERNKLYRINWVFWLCCFLLFLLCVIMWAVL